MTWRCETQENGTQHNDAEHIEPNDIQRNNTQPDKNVIFNINDTLNNVPQHHASQHNDNKHSDVQITLSITIKM